MTSKGVAWLFSTLFALLLIAPASGAVALGAGIGASLLLGNPFVAQTRSAAQKLLSISVVLLGAGMNLRVVASVGLHGFGYTAIGIVVALGLGTLLGRMMRVPPETSLLVSVGTAICGGSAIAAVAPAIRAKSDSVTMALVTVFLLNGVALVTFPYVGHQLLMSEPDFGLWCALAIHDTSSVVGAASQYGVQALNVATSAKLARALWIVPLTFAIAARWRSDTANDGEPAARAKQPWFILGFVCAAAIASWVPGMQPVGQTLSTIAKHILVATLFLIGLGLSRSALRSLGWRPMAMATALWLSLAASSLFAIRSGLIH